MEHVWITLIFILTTIGLLGLSWTFYRLYQQGKNWLKSPMEWVNIFSLILSLILSYFAISTIYKLIFKCFAGLHCSASQSGEMIFLSQFAVILIVYEIILFVLSFCRKKLY